MPFALLQSDKPWESVLAYLEKKWGKIANIRHCLSLFFFDSLGHMTPNMVLFSNQPVRDSLMCHPAVLSRTNVSNAIAPLIIPINYTIQDTMNAVSIVTPYKDQMFYSQSPVNHVYGPYNDMTSAKQSDNMANQDVNDSSMRKQLRKSYMDQLVRKEKKRPSPVSFNEPAPSKRIQMNSETRTPDNINMNSNVDITVPECSLLGAILEIDTKNIANISCELESGGQEAKPQPIQGDSPLPRETPSTARLSVDADADAYCYPDCSLFGILDSSNICKSATNQDADFHPRSSGSILLSPVREKKGIKHVAWSDSKPDNHSNKEEELELSIKVDSMKDITSKAVCSDDAADKLSLAAISSTIDDNYKSLSREILFESTKEVKVSRIFEHIERCREARSPTLSDSDSNGNKPIESDPIPTKEISTIDSKNIIHGDEISCNRSINRNDTSDKQIHRSDEKAVTEDNKQHLVMNPIDNESIGSPEIMKSRLKRKNIIKPIRITCTIAPIIMARHGRSRHLRRITPTYLGPLSMRERYASYLCVFKQSD